MVDDSIHHNQGPADDAFGTRSCLQSLLVRLGTLEQERSDDGEQLRRKSSEVVVRREQLVHQWEASHAKRQGLVPEVKNSNWYLIPA